MKARRLEAVWYEGSVGVLEVELTLPNESVGSDNLLMPYLDG